MMRKIFVEEEHGTNKKTGMEKGENEAMDGDGIVTMRHMNFF